MVGVTISALSVTRVLSPVLKDLYQNAKGQVKSSLSNWNTDRELDKIGQKLAKLENVRTMWSPNEDIGLHEFYYPSKILFQHQEIAVEFVKDLPTSHLIIEGTVGQGKSIFMRYLATQATCEGGHAQLPVLLELRNIDKETKLRTLIDEYFTSIGLSDATSETFEYLAKSGKVLLLLDGFDEIPKECVVRTLREIASLQGKFTELQIVVSSRPNTAIHKTAGFSQAKLVPLSIDDYDPFLSRLNHPLDRRDALIAAIIKGSLTSVVSTPLMLTLVMMVYQRENHIPPTLPEFFDKLFHVVFTKHDGLKAGFARPHNTNLSERLLQKLFESFCFMVVQLGYGRTLKRGEFSAAFEEAIQYTDGCDCTEEHFKKDLVDVACLMLEEGLDLTTFLHKSILDYFSAAFIKNSTDEVAELFYTEVAKNGSINWEGTLHFLATIDSIRYSRLLVLPNIPHALNKLESLVTNRNEQDIKLHFKEQYPSLKIMYKPQIELCVVRGIWRPETAIPWEALIDRLLYTHIDRTIEAPENQSLTKELYGSFAQEIPSNSFYEATFTQYVAIFGIEGILSVLSRAILELEIMLREAEHSVSLEEKKKNIFIRKK